MKSMLEPLYIPNFYDNNTKKLLNNWTKVNSINENYFEESGNNPFSTSYTTRFKKNVVFPDVAYNLQQKIIDYFKWSDYKLRYGHGIINTICYPRCEVFEHIDGKIIEGYTTYHCNIVTCAPESGGNTIIEGKVYKIAENDLLCYAVSRLKHSVNLITGSRLRIVWIFGFHLPDNLFE